MCISTLLAPVAPIIGLGALVKKGIDDLSPDDPGVAPVVRPPEAPDPAEEFADQLVAPTRERGDGLAFGAFFLEPLELS